MAILFSGGALLGAAALSIDIGGLMEERSQLQNSADAAAMSLAQTCAEDIANCVATDPGAAALNNANSSDGISAFDTNAYAHGICGRSSAPALASTSLPACNPPTGKITDCTNLPSTLAGNSAIPYVEVHNKTEIPGGSTLFPTPLIATLAGMPSGTSVAACSRAEWGSPGAFTATVPITFSECEWQKYVNQDGQLWTAPSDNVAATPSGFPPGYGDAGDPNGLPEAPPRPQPTDTGFYPLTSPKETTIYLQGHGDVEPCNTFNGHDTAGGFGYLDNVNCEATVTSGNWVQVKTGLSFPCDDSIIAALRGHLIYIPVFDCMYNTVGGAPTIDIKDLPSDACVPGSGNGNNTWYHVSGWAPFYLSGYKIGGSQQDASYRGAVDNVLPPCSGADRCLSGWFVGALLPEAPVNGPPKQSDYGGYAIQPAG